MSEKRMAGDKLRDANFAARERLSNNAETAAARAAKVGDEYDVSGYSDKEISMALQGDSFLDDDYARLTGKSMPGTEDAKPDAPAAPIAEEPKPVAPVQPPAVGEQDQWMQIPGAAPGPDGGGMSQNVQQDNDITTSITGDGNTVTNQQDNSVSQGFLGGYMRKHNFFK